MLTCPLSHLGERSDLCNLLQRLSRHFFAACTNFKLNVALMTLLAGHREKLSPALHHKAENSAITIEKIRKPAFQI